MTHILDALIMASERAACVARSCCTGSTSEALVVAEKSGGEANARFDKDFKTIADVLAQESARTEIASRCPQLAEHVRGEECAEIGGVSIKVKESCVETAELLSQLVPPAAAKRMAEAVHCDISLPIGTEIPKDLPCLSSAALGVWIDPIDATAEFIAGVRGDAETGCGLSCVTVLIGAYQISTGQPIMGVINQPFFNNGKGRIIWGVCYDDTKKWCESITEHPETKTILMSGAEKPEVAEKFGMAGWNVKSVPGAGHKLLKVALGEAAAYLVSQGTTFRWDTCAPHAILRAKGGDLLCYTTHNPITYNDPMNIDTQLYSNSGGIIAYKDQKALDEIKCVLN